MDKIKAIIISSFILVIISASIGVAIYYSYLSPFRALAREGSLGGLMAHVTYLEYNATDQDGANYLVKLWNNPSGENGKAELYKEGSLQYTLYYNYTANGLTGAKIVYPNGTVKDYTGAKVVAIEDYFLSSIEVEMNATSNAVLGFKPFPGIGPVYLPLFLKDRAQIDWSQLAHITRRPEPSRLMDVRIGSGSVKLLGGTLKGATVIITPRVINPPNVWTKLSYTMFLAKYRGIVIVPTWSVELTVPGHEYRVEYALLNIKTG